MIDTGACKSSCARSSRYLHKISISCCINHGSFPIHVLIEWGNCFPLLILLIFYINNGEYLYILHPIPYTCLRSSPISCKISLSFPSAIFSISSNLPDRQFKKRMFCLHSLYQILRSRTHKQFSLSTISIPHIILFSPRTLSPSSNLPHRRGSSGEYFS